MILTELYQRSPEAYQDVAQDNTQPALGQLRKTKLTLRQINKLRKMNDVRAYEFKEKLKDVKTQYAPPAQPVI
jgi:prephenate dehydrogenase